jgi:hypothetical protein
MFEVFVRTEILARGGLTRGQLRWNYSSIFPVGLDYDGQHHSVDRRRYVYDIGRAELIEREGWIDIHVVAEHSPRFIIHWVLDAFARRGYRLKLRPGS